MTKQYPIQMIFSTNDLQMKTKRLNGFDYKISTIKIRYLQVGEFAHLLRGECLYCPIYKRQTLLYPY